LLLDLPGAGDRRHEKAPLTIANFTDMVRADFLSRRGDPKESWFLIGISLGGMISLDWADRYPQDFLGTVVMNTSSKDSGTIWQRLTPFGWYKIIQTVASQTAEDSETRILEMVSNLKAKDLKTLQAFIEIAKQRPVSQQNLARQVIAASQFLAPDQTLKNPLLILASLKDNMVDVRCSRALAEHLSAQIKFHPCAGHEITIDDPDWVLEQLAEFLAHLP